MGAQPALLCLDGLTLQALTGGAVTLPNGRRLHGGSWLRMGRAVIDAWGLTLKEAHQARGTLRVFWAMHGLGYREGLGRSRPVEMYPPEWHHRLLTVAGTARSMLCTGEVASRSPGATLLASSVPQDDLVSRPPPASGGRHSTRDTSATPTLGELLQPWIARCRPAPARAAHLRQGLLAGARRRPAPAAYGDPLRTELGIPIIPVVTSEPLSSL